MPHLSASCRRTSARTKFSVISVEVTEVTSLAKEPRPKDPLKTHKNTMRSLEIIGDHMRSCEIIWLRLWDHLTANWMTEWGGYTVQNMADKQPQWYQPCELRQSALTRDAHTHETPTIASMDLTMTISTIEPTWANMSQHLQILAKNHDSYPAFY